jgi:putative FmdB family regulatory protein
MPTYEFSCPEGHDFEKFYRTISAAPAEVECPVCGRPATRKVSGGAGLLFKGSGFYITDYGKDGKKDQKSAASGNGTSAASDTSKADSSAPKSDSSSSASGGSSTSSTKSGE